MTRPAFLLKLRDGGDTYRTAGAFVPQKESFGSISGRGICISRETQDRLMLLHQESTPFEFELSFHTGPKYRGLFTVDNFKFTKWIGPEAQYEITLSLAGGLCSIP